MQISHEVPISLLWKSRQFNDYDYALVHLYESLEKYKEYYIDSVKKNRHVLLDNSIFELGVSFDPTKYAKIIEELRPTEYIVPDVLEDCDKTCESLDNWLKQYKDLPGKRIAVIQGKTYEEIKNCLKYIYGTQAIHKIGISFDYSLYLKATEHLNSLNKWERFCLGRNIILQKLESDLCLPRNIKYHLLGCSLPQEFKLAKSFSFTKYMFETADTSSPIVHGIYKIKYDERHGLIEKNSMKLADLIHEQVSVEQYEVIRYNTRVFKNFIKTGYS
jgi:hypothetical protein